MCVGYGTPESLFERLRSSRGSFCWSSFRGFARATPAGVAPEPLEESLTPSRVMSPYLTEVLLMFVMEEASIGWFRVGVVTYSLWSERHLPQVELLSGNPSENMCPVRGGQLWPGGILIKRGRCDRGYWSRSIESSGSLPPLVGIPLDPLALALDIPSEFSRQALFFDHSLGIPDSGTRDRLSNPFGGPACDLSRFLSWQTHALSYGGRKGRVGSPFCPLGAPFQVGAVAALYRRGIRSALSVRETRTVRRRIY